MGSTRASSRVHTLEQYNKNQGTLSTTKRSQRDILLSLHPKTKMAAESRNISGGTGWSNGDIFQLVALLIGIPAAIVAFVVLATYYRRRRQRRRGCLSSPLCDSCGALKARTSDETARPMASFGSGRLYSSACSCNPKWRTESADPWMGTKARSGGTAFLENQPVVGIRICSKSETAHIPDPTVGGATIAFPQRLWHSSIRRGRTTWPLTRFSRRNARGAPVEVHGGVLTAQTSASDIPLTRGGETELGRTGTEFLDEVHAYIDRERRDWQEELV
ncbi:hypothetical protein B0T12DRAFT_393662 [Alternaria alternata]|nr:hypothetical protein B0T12DRAFT_393662 [Alternaria alternata]